MNAQQPTEYNFCTYFNFNYLTRGLSLYQSLVLHCSRPFTLWVLCFDQQSYDVLEGLDLPGIRPISQSEFEAADAKLSNAKSNRSLVEYYWTSTPALPLFILNNYTHVNLITYLDADMYCFGDPASLYGELDDESILIVGHRFGSKYAYMPDLYGTFNVGVMMFRRDSAGLSSLRWWRDRCIEWCRSRVENGRFGDQKYLDDWPKRFPRVVVSSNIGVNVAPWNVSEYSLHSDGPSIFVDGHELLLYHFHSFSRLNSFLFEPANPVYELSRDAIYQIYLPYADALNKSLGLVRSVMPGFSEKKIAFGIRELVDKLLMGRWQMSRPLILSRPIRVLSSIHSRQRARIEAGFEAYAAANMRAARHAFLGVLARNPFMLRNKGLISILVETWIGAERMAKYRKWRHGSTAGAT